MMASKFYQKIKDAKIEKEVESVYEQGLKLYFDDAIIEHPFQCDGYIEKKLYKDSKSRILRLIIEFKFEENFNSISDRCKVLIQVLYYLKQFEESKRVSPTVVLVGDKNNTFVVHTNYLQVYLNEDLDWSIAPSEAHKYNSELLLKMVNDENLRKIFVYNINNKFSFKDVADKIKDLTFDIQRYVRITEHNITTIYDYFITKVVKNAHKYDANQLVYMFIDLMVKPNENYLIPGKKNTLHLSNNTNVPVNGDAFNSFFNHFERKYRPSEKEKFTEIADRLIEDTNRRFKGEFYTPTPWVNEAHKMISEQFGDDWKDKYIVWDCAWGTGNLTRDYRFKELYCSTLNATDIEIGKKYNKSSIKFQYDFLNDDLELLDGRMLLDSECKLPKPLLEAIKQNKPIVILINPPYATANNAGTKEGDHKEGVAITRVNQIMKDDDMGACSQQLYAQFLYRIMMLKKNYNLDNINICIYAKSSYMTASSFKKFRKEFLNEFKFTDGMLFQASHFADVKSVWGIDFSIWKSGETIDKNIFLHNLKDVDEDNNIITIGKKNIYNMDGMSSCSDWIKEEVKKIKTQDAPQLGSALIVKPKGRGKLINGALGYYVNVGNSVYKNTTDVFIVSSTSSMANGISIIPENFMKVVSNFAARKLITGKYAHWINDKDEYLVPDINHEKYEEWNNDALIYSLFNTSSAQSSLRDIEYANKKWNIKNEFFFMSVDDIEELADEHENDDIYDDIKAFGDERYVYKLLKNIILSEESQLVLDKAIELTKKSFKYRNMFNEEKLEYQINTWDAGWYQIKGVLNEYMKDEYKEFVELYRNLEEKMRPMVYELGFLK